MTIAVLVALSVAMPAALSYTQTAYALNRPAARNEMFQSASSTNSGGRGWTNGGDFGAGEVTFTIRTTGVSSGFVYGRAVGGSWSVVSFTHVRAGQTRGQCWWTFYPDVGGTIPLTCYRYAE